MFAVNPLRPGWLTWSESSARFTRVILGPNQVRHSKVAKRRKDTQRNLAPHLKASHGKRTNTQLALSYFDDHYGKIYGSLWPSLRLGLLSRTKNAALVNNFNVAPQVKDQLSALGASSLRSYLPGQCPVRLPPTPRRATPAQPPPDRPTISDPHVEPEESREPELLPSMPLDPDVLYGRVIQPQSQSWAGHQTLHQDDYVPPTQLQGLDAELEAEFVDSQHYDSYLSVGSVQIEIRAEPGPYFPPHLDAYLFPYSSFEAFPAPKRTLADTFNYFCLDAASLLPVVAMGLASGDRVLDMCAAPGGKSLAMLQTLLPSELMCNDENAMRLRRVSHVMDMYLKGVKEMAGVVSYKRLDGSLMHSMYSNYFDKVLCDVPCLTDRVTARDDHNNLFSASNKHHRLNLPITQAGLLVSALKCVKPGGSVVYSTCTLSPIQNDGVVFTALKTIWETTDIECYVSDMSDLFRPFHDLMRFHGDGRGAKYGQLVLPDITRNFGPMYLARIVRTR
ncbi:5-methylcytosine rRNA methyltransferase NSUN4-like [Tigriopus californicus]|uniref:5-methylcytosine rRNA methyltransferase NSUN4-like n=1 Tax=Tigriopus californicus TaxID=6832 RepID=UPI0027DA93F0|nr:5-methylcytosine rRNA methyltransferase NSUN4-like [Tigriopus californicus]